MTRTIAPAFLLALAAGQLPAQFFAPDLAYTRAVTRVTWLGMSGEQSLAIDYGQPTWRDGHDRFMAGQTAQYVRLGQDTWTTLQTNVDLTFAGKRVPRGRWYLGLHRDEHQAWLLTLLAADKADSAGRPAGATIDGTPDLEIPLQLEHVATAVPKLDIALTAIRSEAAKDHDNVALTMTWGPWRLRGELRAAFDTRVPAGAPSFAAANPAKTQTTESGLQYEQLRAGVGPFPKADDKVRVHYVGWLADGTQFDSSYQRGEPAVFPIGAVVKGFAEGLRLMQPGATFRLTLPPGLAYGERGAGAVIPPNATLVFTVTLIALEP